MEDKRVAIELKGITKKFGSVVANDHIDLSVREGEILALLGENGSGKTTLMNVLSGIYAPDSGAVSINGQEVSIHSPEDSKRLGIGMVHQHFKLVENFSAADNIWIGAEGEKAFLQKDRYEKIQAICKQFGFELDPKKKIYDMSVSEKQTVEILKVLYYGAKVLILDEPTAVLTVQEIRKLFAILRKMKQSGCAIIIITHKLNEVLEISDRVTILRKGQSIGTVTTSQTNAQELTDMMVGRAVELAIDRPESTAEETLLEVQDLTILNEEGVKAIDNVSFALKSGEILGVAGVSGCGQKELCEAIAGLQRIESGSIVYKGERIDGKSPRDIIKHGISMSFIPEDRLGMGLAASLSSTDNMMLKNYRDHKGPFVDRKTARAAANRVIEELEVVTPGTETPVRRLSGGNVQKILLGREIQNDPSVMITAYPVRGLDINSSYTIYNILNQQKQQGVGVLFIGEDLDVMLELCDRIMVLCHGKVTGMLDARDASKETIGLMMTDALASADYSSAEKAETKEAVAEAAEAEDAPVTDAAETKETEKKTGQYKAKKTLFHIAKRGDLPLWKSALLYACAVLLAIVAGGLFVMSMGVNPFDYYGTLITGCFNNAINLKNLLLIMTPLLITSLGVSVAFKMKFWNLGANGQFIAGAVSATAVALLLGNALPQWLTLLILFLAGAIGGGLYGLLPAVFHVKFGTNESLLTLMLNYIAVYLLAYFKNLVFFRKVTETGELLRPDFKTLPENAWMYSFKIGGVTVEASLIVALALVVFVFIYFRYTKQGYEVSVVGDSHNTALYAGMHVSKIVLRTMFLSAALAGVAGMLQVTGSATTHTLSEGITADVGWTGVIVAWLAKLNPVGILVTTFLMSILQKGSAVAESAFKIPSASSAILQGIILFTVLAADFFIQYKIEFNGRKGEKA